MNILLTGGTGFIGRQLCHSLQNNAHQLTVFSRQPETVHDICGKNVQAINSLDTLNPADHFDAIINLAGAGIVDQRWSRKRKQTLIDSRIKVTEQLINFIARSQLKPEVIISSSAIGYYGNQGSKKVAEQAPARNDFAHQLCAQWEAAALQAKKYNTRVCIIRTGLVIGKNGGFISRMLPAFKLGLGGRLGDGKQWMSWLHLSDLIAIIELLLQDKNLQGAFNATSPYPVTNQEMTRKLAKYLNRPALIPVPGFVLKLLLGEMSDLLLNGQRVIPQRLLEANFEYQFASLDQALADVL